MTGIAAVTTITQCLRTTLQEHRKKDAEGKTIQETEKGDKNTNFSAKWDGS